MSPIQHFQLTVLTLLFVTIKLFRETLRADFGLKNTVSRQKHVEVRLSVNNMHATFRYKFNFKNSQIQVEESC